MDSYSFLTVWLPEHVKFAHLIQLRRFRPFFAGRHSPKEFVTHTLRANRLTASRVVTVGALDISELGVKVEGCDCSDIVGY